MICSFITGYLGKDLKEVFTNTYNKKVYSVSLCVNTAVHDSQVKGKVEKTIWCNGLINEDKLTPDISCYTKGSPVSAVANNCHYSTYTDNNGIHHIQYELGYINNIFVGGKLNQGGSYQQYQQPVQHQQVSYQQPVDNQQFFDPQTPSQQPVQHQPSKVITPDQIAHFSKDDLLKLLNSQG